MKKVLRGMVTVSVIAAIGFIAGCDWEDSDDFNTARGAGATVNVSGVYTGYNGDLLTHASAAASVTRLVVTQIGNTIELRDNHNSYYTGRIGSPGVVSQPDSTGTYPAGAEMLQAQVNFSGQNADSDDTVEFVGLIRVVAITEVTSVTTTLTIQTQTPTDTYDQTSQYQFTLTEANSKFILEGNWVEDGNVYVMSGEARAAGGNFVTAAPAAANP
jgi:hypothetical protein